MSIFSIIIFIIILQRFFELLIAKQNERKMLSLGAYEVGASHYPLMILLHVSFFISLIVEVATFERNLSPLFPYFFIFFLFVQALRIWCIATLGMYWNTKIIILPGADVVKKGPYNYLKHPNYFVVCCEILMLPLMFEAYLTAIVFTILNIAILSVRISIEEKALTEATNYYYKFKKKIQYPS